MSSITRTMRSALGALAAIVTLSAGPLAAQSIETVDPDMAIDADLIEQPGEQPVYAAPTQPESSAAQPGTDHESPAIATTGTQYAPAWSDPVMEQGDGAGAQAVAADEETTYRKDDLIGAAEGVFGKGAEGLARMIEDLLADQGEPNGYIVGREGSAAFIFGARYGSGTLFHKVEGERTVYWTGPSVGFDAGANAANTFVLVYNLYDSEQLYERYPAGEGQAYVVGGLTASYMRKGDVVLIPIRMGAGLRLGINAGYMKFSKKQRWLPF